MKIKIEARRGTLNFYNEVGISLVIAQLKRELTTVQTVRAS